MRGIPRAPCASIQPEACKVTALGKRKCRCNTRRKAGPKSARELGLSRETEKVMSDGPEEKAKRESSPPAPHLRARSSQLWLILPFCLLALAAGAALARLAPVFRGEWLPVLAAALATAVFAFLLNRQLGPAPPIESHETIGEGLRQLLDSAGPAVLATDDKGRLIYCNPAAERFLVIAPTTS